MAIGSDGSHEDISTVEADDNSILEEHNSGEHFDFELTRATLVPAFKNNLLILAHA